MSDIVVSSPSSLFFLRSGLQLMCLPSIGRRSFHRRDAHHGHPLVDCIARIHDDVLKIWNFKDPSKEGQCVYPPQDTIQRQTRKSSAVLQCRTGHAYTGAPVIRTPYLSMRQHNYQNKKPHTQGMPEVQRLPKHPPKSLNTSLYQKSSAPRKALKPCPNSSSNQAPSRDLEPSQTSPIPDPNPDIDYHDDRG
jgi:hypothetical protein